MNVNHRIREKSESDGDTSFVLNFCEKLGVECEVFEFAEGAIHSLAKERGLGIEEAARFCRYEAFESFIAQRNLDVLCLAHNQNDQLETVLMRFFQGGDGKIMAERGKFFRPLLDISRPEIEAYLRAQKISWMTDGSNSDNAYYRNKVRNLLLPKLDELFPGWKNGVLSFAEKNSFDAAFLDMEAKRILDKTPFDGGAFAFSAEMFFSLPKALRRRIVLFSLNKIGVGGRIPYKMIRPVLFWENDGSNHKISGFGIEISEKKIGGKSTVVIQKSEQKKIIESGFCFLIQNESDLDGLFSELSENGFSIPADFEKFRAREFPFVISGKNGKFS